MGREVRHVAANWEHPKDEYNKRYKPLHEGYSERLAEFELMRREKGLQEALDYFGGAPDVNDYMPEWKEAETTHIQMYETCSEGTPISPVMDTPENLARWLADNNASSFGSMTATYEQWLRVCRGGYAPSAVASGGRLVSGVEGL